MKQRITRLGTAVLLAAGVTVALAAPSQAGDQATTNIAKVVIGTPDPAATFTVNYACAGNQTVNQNFTFNAAGAPSPQPDSHVTFGFIGTCTITETNTGGAVHVTYACAINPLQPNATCSGGGASPVVITFTAPGAIGTTVGTVTVTNDFTPDPAVAVVAPANFTG